MGKFRVLDLFSGIGGFSLGLERTGGFETVAFCEIDPFCRRVLAKHWPEVPQYDDVRELTAKRLARDGAEIDVICGGFPCQDISVAGRGAGLEGERSGLWHEYVRLIGELRPRYVLVENVSALLVRGLDRVLGSLAPLGYDAEWHCIPASAVGAPHERDRLWIVAYPHGGQCLGPEQALFARWDASRRGRQALAITEPGGREGRDAEGRGPGPTLSSGWWAIEPAMGRMAHGVPGRVDRLRALGNAVVPQIPELIGNAILASLATPTHPEPRP